MIEGASQGKGLGHQFLRHIERCRVIVHVIDMGGTEGRDPYEDYLAINKELGEYNKENRNFIKALKMQEELPIYDFEILLDDDHKVLKETQKLLGNKVKVFHISSAII